MDNNTVLSKTQTDAFVEKVFKSAGGRRSVYRVVLKKAILDNIDSLRLLEEGNLVAGSDAVVNQVMEVLEESKNGLIPQKELKEAVMTVLNDNNLDIENSTLVQMVDAVFISDDGTKTTQMSRHSVRKALEHHPELQALSESLEAPAQESLEQKILRHCEEVASGTISKSDLTTAILKTC